ncbi:MAG TPA: helix-turn-helix domain-containing protein, partial [Desulfobacterales bacterium]|nr:helix-turn-helix domain-containing protein [Desulfobacterales bacterium]
MDDSGDLMTTQQVAHLSGVGATSVKRWTDAGLIACVRTAGGHRRFARSEVERFLGAHPAANEPAGREPWVGALLEAGDPRALEALLLSERARTGAWHRVASLVGKALADVGRLWSTGAVTVFEEHQASERLSR